MKKRLLFVLCLGVLLVGCGKKEEPAPKAEETKPKFESQINKDEIIDNTENDNDIKSTESNIIESSLSGSGWDDLGQEELSQDSIDYVYINGDVVSASDFLIPDEAYLYSYLANYTRSEGIIQVNDTVFSEYTDESKFYECANTDGLTTYDIKFETFSMKYDITYEAGKFTNAVITVTSDMENCPDFYIVDKNDRKWFITDSLVFDTAK